MPRVKSKEVKIYAPESFKATWQKYLEICERDGTNASREIRKFVESQVAKRAPRTRAHRGDKLQTRLFPLTVQEASPRVRAMEVL